MLPRASLLTRKLWLLLPTTDRWPLCEVSLGGFVIRGGRPRLFWRARTALDAQKIEPMLHKTTICVIAPSSGRWSFRCQEALALDIDDISWSERPIRLHGKGDCPCEAIFLRAVGAFPDMSLAPVLKTTSLAPLIWTPTDLRVSPTDRPGKISQVEPACQTVGRCSPHVTNKGSVQEANQLPHSKLEDVLTSRAGAAGGSSTGASVIDRLRGISVALHPFGYCWRTPEQVPRRNTPKDDWARKRRKEPTDVMHATHDASPCQQRQSEGHEPRLLKGRSLSNDARRWGDALARRMVPTCLPRMGSPHVLSPLCLADWSGAGTHADTRVRATLEPASLHGGV
jgi:hypothetical protein